MHTPNSLNYCSFNSVTFYTMWVQFQHLHLLAHIYVYMTYLMYACEYIYICIYIYTHMYTHIYIYIYIHTYVCTRGLARARTHTCTQNIYRPSVPPLVSLTPPPFSLHVRTFLRKLHGIRIVRYIHYALYTPPIWSWLFLTPTLPPCTSPSHIHTHKLLVWWREDPFLTSILIHGCHRTHASGCHVSNTSLARPTPMHDMPHSHAWHDSFVCDILVHSWHAAVICVTSISTPRSSPTHPVGLRQRARNRQRLLSTGRITAAVSSSTSSFGRVCVCLSGGKTEKRC